MATSAKKAPRWSRTAVWLRHGVWAYLILVCVVWILLRALADRWWVGTVLLLGPRWVWGLPLAVLVPVATFLRPRALIVLGVAAVIIVFPLMGFCLPPPHSAAGVQSARRLRVLTCNLHGRASDLSALTRLLREIKPDVVALQEWPREPTLDPFAEGTWYVVGEGDLLLASRYPVEPIRDQLGPAETTGFMRCRLLFARTTIEVFNIHLATPHRALDELAQLDQAAVQDIRRNIGIRSRQSVAIAGLARSSEGTALLAGDFNTPCDSAIYGRDWSGGFSDAFASSGFGFGYTYRVRRTATRIDHIVVGSRWRCTHCWVAGGIGSPHRPLIADVELSAR